MADTVAADDITGYLMKALTGSGTTTTTNSLQASLAQQAANSASDVDVNGIIQAALDKAGQEFAPNLAAQNGAGGYNSKTLEMLRQYAAVQGATQGAETAAKLQLQKAATIADAAKAAQGSTVKSTTGATGSDAAKTALIAGLVGEGSKYVKSNYKDIVGKIFGGQGASDNELVSKAKDVLTVGSDYGNEGYSDLQDSLLAGGDTSGSATAFDSPVSEMFTDAVDGSYTGEELQSFLSSADFTDPGLFDWSSMEDTANTAVSVGDMIHGASSDDVDLESFLF